MISCFSAENGVIYALYKEVFFRLLGVIIVAMVSLGGEMNPGKKMGSKYHLVSEI